MEKNLTPGAIAIAIAAMLSLVVDVMMVSGLYWMIEKPASSLGRFSEVVRVLALLWVCKHLKVTEPIQPVVILLLILLFRNYGLQHVDIDLPVLWDSISFFALSGITTAFVAFMWIVVGSHLCLNKKAQSVFNGYAPVLGLCACIVGVFEIVAFLETPRYIGYGCMSVSLIGLILSLKSTRFKLGYLSRSRFLTATIGFPSLLYVAPAAIHSGVLLKDIGLAVVNDTEYREASGMAAAPIDRINNWQYLLDESLAGYENQSSLKLFNDVWLNADGSQFGVGNEGLFRRESPDEVWAFVQKLEDGAEATAIKFDANGVRGVIDLGYGQVAITEDGGVTWWQPDLFEVFEHLAGREFGEKWMDDYSKVHLDPVTGAGSFVMGCRYFFTENFAQDWEMVALQSKQEKRICLDDSPFALDLQSGVAVSTSLSGLRTIYIKSDNGEWTGHCVVDSEVFQLSEFPECDSASGLESEQLAYLDRVLSDDDTVDVHAELFDRMVSNEEIASEALAEVLRENGTQRWLSGRGFLIYVDDIGSYRVDHRIPALDGIYPVDHKRALGISDTYLYSTADAGRTWGRLHGGDDSVFVLGQAAVSGDIFYYTDDSLYRWSGDKSVKIFSALPPEELNRLFVSPLGESLLLTTYDEYYWYSSDAGARWSKHKIPTPPAQPDEYGDMASVYLTSFDCLLKNSSSECVALYENAEVYRWSPENPSSYSALQSVELPAGATASGEISVFNATPGYHYLPGGNTSQLRVLVDDKWELTRLPDKYDYFSSVKFTPDRKKALVWTDESEVLLIDPAGEHQLFRFEDEIVANAFCSDDAGELTLITAHNRLAISNDSGSTWYANHNDASYSTACGHYGGWLWMVGDSLAVYKKHITPVEVR